MNLSIQAAFFKHEECFQVFQSKLKLDKSEVDFKLHISTLYLKRLGHFLLFYVESQILRFETM